MGRENEEKLIRELNERHEQHTNRVVGLVLLGQVAINIITQLMLTIDYSQNVSTANKYIFLPLSVIVVIFYLTARHFHFDAPWIKYMLTGGVVLMSTGQFFVFTTFSTYALLLPLVISARYFDKGFIAKISAVSAVLFAVACVLNLHMADRWELVRFAHESNVFDPWGREIDAIVFLIIPLGLTAIFVAAYSINMTKNGRSLLNAKAQSACRIAVVDSELAMAAELQKSALPAPAFSAPGGNFCIEAVEIPAKEVGGDFYDYFMLNDHTLAVLLADVSDKGVPAAMFMMSAKKALRCALECCHSLQEAIVLANRLICENNESDMFLTLWLGVIDIRTGVGKYVNAGHTPPLVRTSSGKAHWITNEPDMFLGSFSDMNPAVHSITISAGDTLLLYTDGITDSMNRLGECFGTERLKSAIEGAEAGAKSAVEHILTSSSSFAAGQEQFDDMTMLALHCVSTEPLITRSVETVAGETGTASVMEALNELLAAVNCPEDARRNADVVIDEICANIADYAYPGQNGVLSVSAEAGQNFLRMVFGDEGTEFNPLEQAEPLFGDEPAVGGLGIYFVKNLADQVSYCRCGNRNELTVEMIWGI